MNLLDAIWLIPLFPLAGAALMLVAGKRLSQTVISVLCPGTVLLSFLLSAGAVEVAGGFPCAHVPEHRVSIHMVHPGWHAEISAVAIIRYCHTDIDIQPTKAIDHLFKGLEID